MRRIPEIIYIVSFSPEPFHDLGVIRIPPAGGDINVGHLLNEDSDVFRIILTIIVFPAYLSSNLIRMTVHKVDVIIFVLKMLQFMND